MNISSGISVTPSSLLLVGCPKNWLIHVFYLPKGVCPGKS